MCGIVGEARARPDGVCDVSILKRMAARLVHRGPDDEGFVARGPAGLGMRRLKIIDLEGGRQPMTGEDGSVWVVCNGEIYNHVELAHALEARGHVFKTRSDTEVLVHGYEEWGLGMVDRLEGMFAFAVWDDTRGRLLLVRDRLGVKPLYYARLPDRLLFASELKALLEHPSVEPTLDLRSLSLYLAHEYVPAPGSIVRSIRKLPAGHRLSYARGDVRIERYWDVEFRQDRVTVNEAVERLRATLDDAVRQHLVSDVPIGAFLSGGIDSSTVTALAARHVTRLQTFSIGFEDASFDESAHAREVARALGTDHHEARFAEGDALDILPSIPDLADEPLADPSLLPTFLLSRFARRTITVALSGDGGDEVFAGYPTYQAHRVARIYERVPPWLREGVVRPLVERLPVSFDNLSLDFRLKRFVAGIPLDPVERHACWMGAFTPEDQRALFTPDALAALGSPPSYEEFRRTAAAVHEAPWLDRILYLDLKGYLGEGVLTKVDRASMACSLEVRVPLLDRRVVELVATFPPHLKLRALTTKYLLKRAARDLIPRRIVGRRKKGFGIPLGRWFCGALAPLLRDVLSPSELRRLAVFRPETVAALLEDHERRRRDHRKKLYALLVFQLWSRRWGVG